MIAHPAFEPTERQIVLLPPDCCPAMEYETALAPNRNWVGVLFALGQCKLFAGSIEEVIPLAKQAIRLSPRDPNIGLWYQQIGFVHLLRDVSPCNVLRLRALDALMASDTFGGRACDEFRGRCGVQSLARGILYRHRLAAQLKAEPAQPTLVCTGGA
jgi:hypothetical protein